MAGGRIQSINVRVSNNKRALHFALLDASRIVVLRRLLASGCSKIDSDFRPDARVETSAAGNAHVASDSGTLAIPVDDEVVALGFTENGVVDCL